jgi:hypothetical protein
MDGSSGQSPSSFNHDRDIDPGGGFRIKRTFLLPLALVAAFSGGLVAATGQVNPSGFPEVTLYKSELRPCCDKWADHLTEAGFRVNVQTVTDLAAGKAPAGVPKDLGFGHDRTRSVFARR